MRLIGRTDLCAEPWFATGEGRAAHVQELDEAVGGWIGQRDLNAVVDAFDAAGAAAAPVYDISDVMCDPQYAALGTLVDVPDDDLGELRMQNIIFRLLSTPGQVRWAGRRIGQDDDMVYADLGVSSDQLQDLRKAGVIRT